MVLLSSGGEEEDPRAETLWWRQDERVGLVQPGEEKAPGSL